MWGFGRKNKVAGPSNADGSGGQVEGEEEEGFGAAARSSQPLPDQLDPLGDIEVDFVLTVPHSSSADIDDEDEGGGNSSRGGAQAYAKHRGGSYASMADSCSALPQQSLAYHDSFIRSRNISIGGDGGGGGGGGDGSIGLGGAQGPVGGRGLGPPQPFRFLPTSDRDPSSTGGFGNRNGGGGGGGLPPRASAYQLSRSLRMPRDLEGYEAHLRQMHCEGYLERLSTKNGAVWKRSWFLLKDGALSYFNDEEEALLHHQNVTNSSFGERSHHPSSKRHLPLDSIEALRTEDDEDKFGRNCFRVISSQREDLILRADTKDDMQEWLFGFHRVLASIIARLLEKARGDAAPGSWTSQGPDGAKVLGHGHGRGKRRSSARTGLASPGTAAGHPIYLTSTPSPGGSPVDTLKYESRRRMASVPLDPLTPLRECRDEETETRSPLSKLVSPSHPLPIPVPRRQHDRGLPDGHYLKNCADSDCDALPFPCSTSFVSSSGSLQDPTSTDGGRGEGRGEGEDGGGGEAFHDDVQSSFDPHRTPTTRPYRPPAFLRQQQQQQQQQGSLCGGFISPTSTPAILHSNRSSHGSSSDDIMFDMNLDDMMGAEGEALAGSCSPYHTGGSGGSFSVIPSSFFPIEEDTYPLLPWQMEEGYLELKASQGRYDGRYHAQLSCDSLHACSNKGMGGEVNGGGLWWRSGVASVMGRRDKQEDRYCVIPKYDQLIAAAAAVEAKNCQNDSQAPPPKAGFFGVYDGHCGYEAAQFAADRLHVLMADVVRAADEAETAGIISRSFSHLDSLFLELCKNQEWYSGTTVLVALLLGSRLLVVSLGDCEAVLCRNEMPVSLSATHKPDREDELERIQRAGGWVTTERELFLRQLKQMDLSDPVIRSTATSHVKWTTITRLCGELTVSRAIGDSDFKGFGPDPDGKGGESNGESHGDGHDNSGEQRQQPVREGKQPSDPTLFSWPKGHSGYFYGDLVTAEPEYNLLEVTEEDKFILLACDGLWDVMSHTEAVLQASDLFSKGLCAQAVSQQLCEHALRLGTSDNVTVIAVSLHHRHHHHHGGSS